MFGIDLWQPGTVAVRAAMDMANASQSSRRKAKVYEAAKLVSTNAVFEDWRTCVAGDTGPLLEHLVGYDFEECIHDLLDLHSIGRDWPTPKEPALLECDNPRAQHSFKQCYKEPKWRSRTLTYVIRLFHDNVDEGDKFVATEERDMYFWDRRALNLGLGLDFTPRHNILAEEVKVASKFNSKRRGDDACSKGEVLDLLHKYRNELEKATDLSKRMDISMAFLELRPERAEKQDEVMLYWHFMANLLIFDLDHRSGGPDRKIFDESTVAGWAHHYSSRVWVLIQQDEEEYDNFLRYQRDWILLNEAFSWYQAWRRHVYEVVKTNWKEMIDLGSYLARSHDLKFRQQVQVRGIDYVKYRSAKEVSVFYWFLKECKGYSVEFPKLMRDYAFKDYRGWPEKGKQELDRLLVKKAIQRARNGDGYTIAHSIRINVVDSILKRKWSPDTIFDKVKTSKTTSFFNGEDYVVADPTSKVIMLYAVDDAWLKSAPHCEQEIIADNNTVLARIVASVLGPTVVGIELTRSEENELTDAAGGNMQKLVTVARDIIARHKFVVSISTIRRRLSKAGVKTEIFNPVLREILHDLLGEEHNWFVSVKSPTKFKCYFEALYHTEVIDDTSTLVVDAPVDLEGARYNTESEDKEGYVVTKSGCKKLSEGRYRMHIENKEVEWRNSHEIAERGMFVGGEA